MIKYTRVMCMISRLPGRSIRYEVEAQIDDLHRQGIHPMLVRLSNKASVQFAYEAGAKNGRVSCAPKLFSGPNCLCHIIYRDPSVRWVKVEGILKQEFDRMIQEGRSPLRELYGV